jgi:hypothetical protein
MELSEVRATPGVLIHRWSGGPVQDTKHEIDEIIPIDFPISGWTQPGHEVGSNRTCGFLVGNTSYIIYIYVLYISDITII